MSKRLFVHLVALLPVIGLLAACGDDDDSASKSGATATTAPEQKRASAAAVAAGLEKLDKLGEDIAAAVEDGDTGKAKDLLEQIEPTWADIEGTVKATDEDSYLSFEDAFAAMGLAVKAGAASDATSAASDITGHVASYLRAHPA